MKKHLSVFLCSLILVCSVFAGNGIMTGEKNLKVAKTQWFDIIYPPECEETAAIFFKNADQVYVEVNQQYGLEPSFRMPLVLTPAVEMFNAYWTSYPYNHVVIYDTGVIDELEVFSKTVLSTFRHEITHAVTYNMKDPFFKFLGKVFGDPVYIPGWLVTSGMAEGATVASESAAGEGRLNDEYAKQYVKQAKIEGKFPSYFEVQGAADISPYGSYYYFNGAFHQWLQQKYGMEKYAQFWYKAVNLRGFVINQVYKKVYGNSIKNDWNEFYNQYEVLQIPGNPVKAGVSKDFFVPATNDYSINNNTGDIFSCLSASSKGIVYLNDSSSSVYFVPAENLSDETIKPKKLFELFGIQGINLSKDGKLLAVDYVEVDGAVYKKHVKIYNLETKSFYNIKEDGLQNGVILEADGTYYVIAQKFQSQKDAVNLYKLGFDGNKIKSYELVKSFPTAIENVPYGFVDLGNGKFAYIEKNGLSYSICVTGVEDSSITRYALPERYCVRTPSFDGNKILFSYTQPGSMPRLGSFDVNTATFEFDNRDISGGVYYPVKNGESISYIGTFFRLNRILKMDNQSGTKVAVKGKTSAVPETAETNPLYPEMETDVSELLAASKKYNPFSFYKRGIIIPYSSLASYSFDDSHSGGDYNLPLGITYISANPWTDGLLQIAAGYGFNTHSVGIGVTYSSTGFISTKTEVEVEFDKYGWKQFNGVSSIGKKIRIGRRSAIGLENNLFYHVGRSNDVINDDSMDEFDAFFYDVTSADKTNYEYLSDQLSVQYSNVHATGSSRYNICGFGLSASGNAVVKTNGPSVKDDLYSFFDLGFAGIAYIPQLIPIKCAQGQTYNLPTKIGVALFSNMTQPSGLGINEYFGMYTSGLSFMNETVLYGLELQKGLQHLYFNELKVSFVYKGGFDLPVSIMNESLKVKYVPEYFNAIGNNEVDYNQAIYLKATVGLVFNQGQFASSSAKLLLTTRAGTYCRDNKFKPYADFGMDISF